MLVRQDLIPGLLTFAQRRLILFGTLILCRDQQKNNNCIFLVPVWLICFLYIFNSLGYTFSEYVILLNLPGAFLPFVISRTRFAAVEVLAASIDEERPGDFGWDPAGIRPDDEDKLNELQTKELKNGRLAMLSTAGMLYQSALTGQGPIEQLTSGHLSPFGDGQGIF